MANRFASMKRLVYAGIIAGALCQVRLARAQPQGAAAAPVPPALPPAGPAEPERRWYGWQTAVATAPFIGMLALSRIDDPDHAVGWMLVPGYVGAVFAGPTVHWLHRDLTGGIVGGGVNVASILLFASLLPRDCDRDADAPPPSSSCRLTPRTLVPPGALVGAGLGAAIDAVLFAWEAGPVDRNQPSGVAVWASPAPGGAVARVGGRF
jgi:hypothetical protein